ncbi:MAG: hypothetical protein LLF76_13890 [Planctomycetaceae bacterium]|nr:hypothetical protein [Planctomycetaceae bacterium]
MTDAAILSPEEWALNRNYSYNRVGDEPATNGNPADPNYPYYSVPTDLPGGKSTPITLITIPKKIWNAYGDPDPIRWMNARLSNPNLEIGQHGTYHANNTLKGDWADMTDRNFYSCETCGFNAAEMFQYLRVGQRTLTGDYLDMWLADSGADPATSPKVDWTTAANPLISYSPPYNAYDTPSRQAAAELGYVGFSASFYDEDNPIFSPEGNLHEQFDPYGLFHASADLQVDPDTHGKPSYEAYLQSIMQSGGLNTWLIEEVEWSTRYCNELPRLVYCSVSGGDNRENNMVDPGRWDMWMTLLDFVNANGQPMTMGDYSLAVAFDNAPTVFNPDQADSDHDGIGDAIDNAAVVADNVTLAFNGTVAEGTLRAVLTNGTTPLVGQTITFLFDADGNGTMEEQTAQTDAAGAATLLIQTSLPTGEYPYIAEWDGILVQPHADATFTVPCTKQADLTGDCLINMDDFAVLAAQWLSAGDPADCSLTADLAGEDCQVNLADLLVLSEQWLN